MFKTIHTRVDSFMNLLSGIGTQRSKSKNNQVDVNYTVLTEEEQYAIWLKGGIGKVIVSAFPEDAVRNWFTIENDTDNTLLDMMKKLKTKKAIELAMCWSRLMGGGAIFMGIQDGLPLSEPVNISKIKEVNYLLVFDKWSTTINTLNYNNNIENKNYGELETITLFGKNGQILNNVHISRLMVFKGEPVPRMKENENNWEFWGASFLESMMNELGWTYSTFLAVADVLQELIIGKYKIRGLKEAISEGREKDIQKRMSLIDISKSTIKSVLLDADNEDYTRDSMSLAGIPDTLYVFMMLICGVSQYPFTRLWGRSPAGLNATGESDFRNYYDKVKASQVTDIEPEIENKLLVYLNASIGNKIKNPKIKWSALQEATPKENLEMKEKQANIDKIYGLDMPILLSEEIRNSRFANGYSFDTMLMDDNTYAKFEIEKKANELELAKNQKVDPNAISVEEEEEVVE